MQQRGQQRAWHVVEAMYVSCLLLTSYSSLFLPEGPGKVMLLL